VAVASDWSMAWVARSRPRRVSSCSVTVLAERRYLSQRQPAGLVEALQAAGHRVEVLEAGAPTTARRLGRRSPDVLVARGRSDDLLRLLEVAEAAGVAVVDTAGSVRAVRDKAEMGRRLRHASLPVPLTCRATTAALAALPDDAFPLVLKPRFGDNGRGVRLLRDRGALAGAGLDGACRGADGELLAQSFVPGEGCDLKLYGVGQEVFAVRRPPAVALLPDGPPVSSAVQLVPVTAALRALARRCAKLFGLGLYGVDCVETPAGPVVIEVNDFPNFTGVPDADDLLAAHVTRAAPRGVR
jgi:ribosomal protein S6--L-glutamate ligase